MIHRPVSRVWFVSLYSLCICIILLLLSPITHVMLAVRWTDPFRQLDGIQTHIMCSLYIRLCLLTSSEEEGGGHIDILTGRDSPGSVNCADILTDRILFHILASSILSSLLLISISNSLGTISTQTHVLAFDAWMFLDEADYLRPGLFMICSNQFFVNKSNLALPNANIKPTSDCSK